METTSEDRIPTIVSNRELRVQAESLYENMEKHQVYSFKGKEQSLTFHSFGDLLGYALQIVSEEKTPTEVRDEIISNVRELSNDYINHIEDYFMEIEDTLAYDKEQAEQVEKVSI